MKKTISFLIFLFLLSYGIYYMVFVASEWKRTTPEYPVKIILEALASGLQYYKNRYGNFPSTDQALKELLEKEIVMHLPKDPWDNDYYYRYEGSRKAYQLCSLGQDGKIGGEGTNEDICSSN